MCGRFVSTTGAADLASHFGAETIVGEMPPRWNVAPTARVWVVHDAGTARTLELMRWGLVPSWATDPSIGNRMFNARAETLTDKPSFRVAARRRRCIVPVDGFYEWKATPATSATSGSARKQAWYFHRADGLPLAMAGLWESWERTPPTGHDTERDRGSDAVRTCTIVTTAADDVVATVHHRMPVVLDGGSIDAWLDPSIIDPDEVRAMLDGAPHPLLVTHAVGPEVNNARNDGPGLINPADRLDDDDAGRLL